MCSPSTVGKTSLGASMTLWPSAARSSVPLQSSKAWKAVHPNDNWLVV